MRKTVKPAIVCDKCGSSLKEELTESFCDYCQKKITDGEGVDITVFWKGESGDNAKHQEFCSLKDARQWLLEFPYNKDRVEFIALPYIHDMNTLKDFLGKDVSA